MQSRENKTFGAAAPNFHHCGGGSYDGKIAGLYDLEETLGSGHFAVVKQARHVFTGAKVAVKVVDKTKLDEVSKAHLFQEVRCMKLVQHPNVVRLYEVIDTQTKLYLVLELGDGGDLYDYIMKHEGGLNEGLARRYFRQILRAITYCHQLHVVHRDLKPENVVFFEKLGVVKLTDFGFSNKFAPGQKLDTFCGSLAYSAPEILLGDSYDAPAVDIWSLGVILYMLVCGQPPFEKANDSETLTMIMDCKYTVPAQVTKSCKDLIASMLVRDPKKRASLEQIAADEWLQENSNCDPNDFLPLVSREEISEEDHAFIIQKIVNGNIATKEEILQALDSNKYNHITATYFLLAEMKLRKRREESIQKGNSSFKTMSKSASQKANRVEIGAETTEPNVKSTVINKDLVSINVCTPSFSNDSKVSKRNRKCSIVREEEEDESAYDNTMEGNELRVALTRRESISDGRLNRSVQDCGIPKPIAVSSTPSRNRELHLPTNSEIEGNLNQIEKNIAGNSKEAKVKPITEAMKGLKDIDSTKYKSLLGSTGKNPVLTHRRTKFNKIRTPSCSSSEASDDDTNVRNKKKINKFVGDTPVRFRMHRRDSHDDSSDSQDQAFPSSESQSNSTNVITANNSNQKKDDSGKSNQNHRNKKQTKDNTDNLEKRSQTKSNGRHHRQRKSQSLDRITEAQEYELRYRCLAMNAPHIEQSNSLFNLKVFSVAETKEEYDTESETISTIPNHFKDALNLNLSETSLRTKRNTVYTLGTIDIGMEEKGLSKSIQDTGIKYIVTMKKIRRLGKYFPVVNCS